MRTALLLALLACPLVAGCSDPLQPPSNRELAWIDVRSLGKDVVARVPETVRAGDLFVVSFDVYYGGCDRAAEVVARADGLRIDISPYLLRGRALSFCPRTLVAARTELNLSFPTPGEARVVLHGRRLTERGDTVEVSIPFDVLVEAAGSPP